MHVADRVETGAWTSEKRCASGAGKLEQPEDLEKHTPTQERHIQLKMRSSYTQNRTKKRKWKNRL